ncbi:MAG: DUF6531 domain-containing protein, partial [Gemmatimonadota bacterium]|nr:DUF6531 domain-containing protein [Gemmatimonadota bacterium]
MIGGKQFDPVLGIDIHIIQPPGPVPPVPIPHPFIGMVLDPMDFVPFVGATVHVNVMPRAQAGSGGMAIPPHIPIGGLFVKPPASECEVFMGSATVSADGDALTSLGLPCLSCSDIGMPAPPRPKGSAPSSLMLPTSVVLCVPMGMPVLVGGPPTISLSALAMKAGMFLGGKLLKKLKKLQKKSGFWKNLSKKLHKKADDLMKKLGIPPGLRNAVHKGICTVTGHPVDVATGRVFTDKVDFELPGPIPLKWERTWYSTSSYCGPLGHGWHHAYDLALSAGEHAIAVRLEDGRGVAFPALEVGEEAFDRFERLTLLRDAHGYGLRTRENLLYRFQPLGGREDRQALSSLETLAGDRIAFYYHANGVLRRIVDSGGRELLLRSDSAGRLIEVLAPHPAETASRVSLVRYHYDGEGDLVEVRDALDQRAANVYEYHLLVRELDRNGLSFYFKYDGRDPSARCIRTWGDGGIYDHKLVYDDEGRTTRVTNSLGHTVTYRHDGAGLVIKTVDPRGGVCEVEYGAFNEKLCEIDPLGQKTFYKYDDRGDTIEVLGPDGAKLQVRYDALSNPLEAVDPNGGRWTWRYDAAGRLIERVDPLGRVSRFQYQGPRLVAFVDPAGQSTRLQYDRNSDITAVTTPDGATSRWEYDRLGRTVAAIDPRDNIQRRSIDLLGQVAGLLEPDGNVREFVYDGEGNVVRARDKQHDVAFTYSGMGRLTSRTEAGTTVRFAYDTEEQLLAIQNEHGFVYRFELDQNGDVAVESGFDGIRRVYKRDLAGRVAEVLRASGLTTAYQYDPAGRVLETKHSDGTKERYQYRRDGELIQAINDACQVRFERDALGQVTKEWQGQYWVASEYDLQGWRVGMRSSLGAVQEIERSGMGDVLRLRHQQLETKGGDAQSDWEARFTRDLLGLELERALPGGVRSRWQRDRLGRPIQHEVLAGDRKWREVRYTWEVNDRLRQVVDLQKGMTRYGHDALGNLAWAQYGDGELELRMPDAVGNLFRREDRRDRKYGRAGELLEATGPEGVTRYRYDLEGNLVEKVQPDGGTWQYHWNAAGMLARVERPDGETVGFAYDALGRRAKKTFCGR